MKKFTCVLVAFIWTHYSNAESVFLPSSTKKPVRLLVFVHGLFGNAKDSWTNKNTNFYLPAEMRKLAEYSQTDILSFEYRSNCSPNFTLNEITGELSDEIAEKASNKNYQELAFVGHSMGGLIIRNFILKHNTKPLIRDVFTLATPTLGNSLANIASVFCNGTNISDVFGGRNSTIDQLNDLWRAKFETPSRKLNFRYHAAYEILPTWKVKIVVEKDSATAFAHYIKAVDKTHEEISKPIGVNDPVFRWINYRLSKQINPEPASIDNLATEHELQKFFEEKQKKLTKDQYNQLLEQYQTETPLKSLNQREINNLMKNKALFRVYN